MITCPVSNEDIMRGIEDIGNELVTMKGMLQLIMDLQPMRKAVCSGKLAKAANKAIKSGSHKDLQVYLELRRQ